VIESPAGGHLFSVESVEESCESETARELVARCGSETRDAFRTLFDAYFDSVYRWAVCFGLDSGAAEDVAQEVFAVAFRRIAERPEDRGLSAWLFQITRRKAANARRIAFVRRALFRERDESEGDTGGGYDLPLDLARTLSRLPRWAVEVLVLHDLDGRSRSEVAAMLGVAEGTAASRLAHAREAFKRLWSEEESP